MLWGRGGGWHAHFPGVVDDREVFVGVVELLVAVGVDDYAQPCQSGTDITNDRMQQR